MFKVYPSQQSRVLGLPAPGVVLVEALIAGVSNEVRHPLLPARDCVTARYESLPVDGVTLRH